MNEVGMHWNRRVYGNINLKYTNEDWIMATAGRYYFEVMAN